MTVLTSFCHFYLFLFPFHFPISSFSFFGFREFCDLISTLLAFPIFFFFFSFFSFSSINVTACIICVVLKLLEEDMWLYHIVYYYYLCILHPRSSHFICLHSRPYLAHVLYFSPSVFPFSLSQELVPHPPPQMSIPKFFSPNLFSDPDTLHLSRNKIKYQALLALPESL